MNKNRFLMKLTSLILGICMFSAIGYSGLDCIPGRAENQETLDYEYDAQLDMSYSEDYELYPGSEFETSDHSVVINNKKIKYTATVGKMPMYDELGEYEIYFNAFTKKGVKDVSKRPITFVFNGGPGAASLWLNIGGLGPERIDVDEVGKVQEMPSKVKENPYSILDLTDLVFIDPVGTGYSYVTGETPKAFSR